MNWKNLITELSEMGVTQKEIAIACSVSQASISELKAGSIVEPRHSFGASLIALHAKHTKRKARLTARAPSPQPETTEATTASAG